MKAFILFSLVLSTSTFAADIDGASCVSDELNENGLRYVVEIGRAFNQPGEYFTVVNKYYKRGDRYPEISYNGNSVLRFELKSGKLETAFSDRKDIEKFSLKIVSGLSIATDGEVSLTERFQAKLFFAYRTSDADAIIVNCIH